MVARYAGYAAIGKLRVNIGRAEYFQVFLWRKHGIKKREYDYRKYSEYTDEQPVFF